MAFLAEQFPDFYIPSIFCYFCSEISFGVGVYIHFVGTSSEIIPIEPARVMPGREMSAAYLYSSIHSDKFGKQRPGADPKRWASTFL